MCNGRAATGLVICQKLLSGYVARPHGSRLPQTWAVLPQGSIDRPHEDRINIGKCRVFAAFSADLKIDSIAVILVGTRVAKQR
jgi:hypothetical protein